jgi:hypothetical protein
MLCKETMQVPPALIPSDRCIECREKKIECGSGSNMLNSRGNVRSVLEMVGAASLV